MSKIVIEDIKKDRPSLREAISSRHSINQTATHKRKPPPTNDFTDDTSSLSWLWGAIIVIGVIVFIGYFVAPMFTQVTVTVSPKVLSLEINEIIDTVRDDLTFTTLPEVEKIISISVPATGEKYLETKAVGKIRITNNFSADPQPLVATTRFTSAKGKTYRIAQNVTVPGMKTGKPGIIETTVYADKIGPDYNDGLTNFTIPGFSNSAKFNQITAQSITPITGGLAGNIKVVASSSEATVRKQINDQLKTELTTLINTQIPDGFFTNNNLTTFSYEINQIVQNDQATNTAVFSGKGKAVALIFNESSFTEKLVSQAISPDSAKNPIKISNLSELSIKITANNQINVSGKPTFLWQIDQKNLANKLVGQPKTAFAEVFNSYGEAIIGGEVIFRPSWSKTFPTDPNRIDIKLLTPN